MTAPDGRGPRPALRSLRNVTLWITRDLDILTGKVDDACEVWDSPPYRFGDDAHSVLWLAPLSEEARLHGHVGRYELAEVRAVFGVVPDDSWMVIRVEVG
jgi:hypothetical protein